MTREEYLNQLTEKTQAEGNSEEFIYISDEFYFHVSHLADSMVAVALLQNNETVSRKEIPLSLLGFTVELAKSYLKGGE